MPSLSRDYFAAEFDIGSCKFSGEVIPAQAGHRFKTAFTTLTIAEFEPMPSLSRDYFAAEFARTNIEFTHSWTWIRGKHSFTWDAELTGSRYNEYNVFNASGVFQFNGRVN